MVSTKEKKKRKFSDEQELAISTRDRTLLVSAAAGSGKTTTLTERIIRSLLDKENPESIRNMLIVTFTNASVFDLKEKIGKALTDAVEENPENKRLIDELHSLGHARIMTIDSFCTELVRANAERLGISPSYRIAEGAETLLLERSVLNSLIDSAFEGELMPKISPEDFETLCDALTGVKNTASLTDKLIALYEKTKSSIRGINIFADFANNYLQYSEIDLEKTPYGRYLIDMAKEALSHFISEKERYILPLLTSDDSKIRALGIDIEAIVQRLSDALSKCESYDAIYSFFHSFELPKAPPVSNPKPPEVIRASKYRQAIKDAILDLKEPFFSYTREEWQELYRSLSKCISTLSSFLSIFSNTYFEEKRRRAALEFSDVERLAYECLWRDGELTEVAKGYRELFSAVYIDEYQDVNELQNKIFEAVAAPRSRFMVGDIKQSIYGFRSAKPEIFAKMKTTFPPLGKDEKSDEASIFMSNNYRCDEGIVDFVNGVFDRLFGAVADSIGYVNADRLKHEKRYEFIPEYERAHICLLPKAKANAAADGEDREDASFLDEPTFVAKKIKELIRDGSRRDGKRINPKDIAIILRTKKRFADYEEALKREGVAATAADDEEFFLNKEILLALSLLNSIDNPRKDIYLAALMCSPLYGFSPSELYKMRATSPAPSLYDSAVEHGRANPNFTKLTRFLDTLYHYRTLAEGMNVDALLARLYRESGLLTLASKQGGKENLLKLYSYARKFEGSSYKGLYNFIAYINSIIETGATIDKRDNSQSEEDAVHIGTIHSSKGLEFPVVFLADASDKIYNLDNRQKIAFSEDFGISFFLRGPRGLALVENPLSHIIHHYADKKFFEEITRLLYVALTRPKEKLYIVGKAPEDAEQYVIDKKFEGENLTAYSVRGLRSYMDMILAADQNADISIVRAPADEAEAEEIGEEIYAEKEESDPSALFGELKKRFSFVYENEHLTSLPEKMSVSALYPTVLDGADENTEKILFVKEEKKEAAPSFISIDPIKESAKRGIATHNFMQFFDIEGLKKNGVSAELSRLNERGFLSDKTVRLVRKRELDLFYESELFSAMQSARAVYREFRFNTRLPASIFTLDANKKELLKNQTVLVQGVIDCLIENPDGTLRLIDYKTDRLTAEEMADVSLAQKKLSEKHSLQLSYYALAVEKIFGKKPTRVEVYSLPLGKTVEV